MASFVRFQKFRFVRFFPLPLRGCRLISTGIDRKKSSDEHIQRINRRTARIALDFQAGLHPLKPDERFQFDWNLACGICKSYLSERVLALGTNCILNEMRRRVLKIWLKKRLDKGKELQKMNRRSIALNKTRNL